MTSVAPRLDPMVTSTVGTPSMVRDGVNADSARRE